MNNLSKLTIVLILVSSMLLASCTGTTISINETTSCSDIEGSGKDICYFDKMQCSKIESSSLKNSCISELAKETQNLDVCELIQDSTISKGYCTYGISKVTNNVELCSQIDNSVNWKDVCYYNYATSNNESGYCSDIGNNEKKTDCYTEIAVATSQAELCLKAEVVESDRCVLKIAKESQNESVCPFMDSEFNQDVCYLKVAKIKLDESICENVKFNQLREDCIEKANYEEDEMVGNEVIESEEIMTSNGSDSEL